MAEYFASRSPEISRREKAHMEAVRALAGECMVLLENNGRCPWGRRAERTSISLRFTETAPDIQ